MHCACSIGACSCSPHDRYETPRQLNYAVNLGPPSPNTAVLQRTVNAAVASAAVAPQSSYSALQTRESQCFRSLPIFLLTQPKFIWYNRRNPRSVEILVVVGEAQNA
jgi:hypothetical protein